jgi:hypothetical protein
MGGGPRVMPVGPYPADRDLTRFEGGVIEWNAGE